MQARDFAIWYKANYARLLAILVKKLSDFCLAEDVLSEACAALATGDFCPDDASAWAYRVAYNAALDIKRRASKESEVARSAIDRHESQAALSAIDTHESQAADLPQDDERLSLIFLCAHPALSPDSQAMLMLRYSLGLEISEIAQWFGSDPDSVRRRLHRAREKIQATKPRFELPTVAQWSDRLAPVLSTLEVLYDQSYSNVGGGTQADAFAREAEQLALQLSAHLPDEAEVLGLTSLIVLAEARRPARLNAHAELVPLDQQDTARWDDQRIAYCSNLLTRAASLLRKHQTLAGSYVLRALISAQHCTRKHTQITPWKAISQLYAALLAVAPSVQAHVNYALSIEKLKGPQAALDCLQTLHDQKHLALFLARAHLMQCLNQHAAAISNLDAALALSLGKAERLFVEKKRHALADARCS
jgi:RNA polymerase sigma-70 factor, ECF subfamily